MNLKALTLILLVIFASASTVFVIGLSSSRTAEQNVGFTKSYNVVQIRNETSVEPNGEIDTPGMPG
jgi:uncharacterized protein YwlG (UPF0340 family)